MPWQIDFLDLLMDFILMFALRDPSARAMQGFFFLLPYIVLWSSSYNTSKYEAFYSGETNGMSVMAWLNGLPWTGVPLVFLQEWYIVLYRVFAFPVIFWRHRYQDQTRRFQLSSGIYEKSKERYVQILRVVFEDLPTTLLLIVVLARGEDNGKLVFFSLTTSIVSCLCTMFALYLTVGRAGRPLYIEVFTTLMSPRVDLSKQEYYNR